MQRNLIAVTVLALCASAQDTIHIANDTTKSTGPRIPRTSYGTFLEPIGKSIDVGLWAQILENPSFEENLWKSSVLRTKLDANPALYRASELGLPVPWEPLDVRQANRHEPRDMKGSEEGTRARALAHHSWRTWGDPKQL